LPAGIVEGRGWEGHGCQDSESGALIRISERGTSRSVLMKFSEEEMSDIAAANGISLITFKKNYMAARAEDKGVCIFQTTYAYTSHDRPPDDGKLRDLKPDLYWLSVGGRHILPKPVIWRYPPLPLNVIYT